MFKPIKNIENSEYAHFGKYLHEQHFAMVFVVAFLLHVMGVAIYYLMPQEDIKEIPVRVLNVKLGGKSGAAAITSSDVNRLFAKRRLAEKQPIAEPTNNISASEAIEKIVEKRVVEEPPKPEPVKKEVAQPKPEPVKKEVARSAMETPKPKAEITPPPPKPKAVEKVEVKEPVKPKPVAKSEAKIERQEIRQPLKTPVAKKPQRYVRSSQLTAKLGSNTPSNLAKNGGSVIGNSSSKGAEVQKRYTQTISLWIDKHKVYPEAARAAGEGGKVILRVRINRQGRVLRFLLEKSSGSEAIDRAITQMIDAANPLPPVPADYPDTKPYLEFLIPINFIP